MLKKTTQWELAVEQLFLACQTTELFVEQFFPKVSFFEEKGTRSMTDKELLTIPLSFGGKPTQ